MPQTAETPTATPTVTHSTFVIERTYPSTPEKVFAAFADPTKKRRWFADRGTHVSEEFTMDFRVGGVDYGRFRFQEGSRFPGVAFENTTTYQDIVPNRRIVFAYTMTFGDHRMSASLATVELLPTDNGTNLIYTEQAAFFEGADGPEMRREGWSKLLDSLDKELTSWRNQEPRS